MCAHVIPKRLHDALDISVVGSYDDSGVCISTIATNDLFPITGLVNYTTTVTCSATDPADHTVNDSFDVIVHDVTDPIVFIPTNVDHDTADVSSDANGIVDFGYDTTTRNSVAYGKSVVEACLRNAKKTAGTDVNYTATETDNVELDSFLCEKYGGESIDVPGI